MIATVMHRHHHHRVPSSHNNHEQSSSSSSTFDRVCNINIAHQKRSSSPSASPHQRPHARMMRETRMAPFILFIIIVVWLSGTAIVNGETLGPGVHPIFSSPPSTSPSSPPRPPSPSSSSVLLSPPPLVSTLGTLVHVHLLHRHGDRAPVTPSLQWSDQWSSLGGANAGLAAGELSTTGGDQLRALGSHLRHAYMRAGDAPLLPIVPRGAVSVRSTIVQRCQQSVRSLLDGLYPGSRWYQPFLATPEEVDEFLLQSTGKCPSYRLEYRRSTTLIDATLRKELSSMKMVEHEDTIGGTGGVVNDKFDLLSYLTQSSGYDPSIQPTSLVSWVTDNLICASAHSLPISPILARSTELLRNISKAIMFHKFSPTHVRRSWAKSHGIALVGDEAGRGMDRRGAVGALIAIKIVRQMERIVRREEKERMLIEEEANDDIKSDDALSAILRTTALFARRARRRSAAADAEKLFIFSAHDTTIIALMQSLGLIISPSSEYLLPPYGASVTFELRHRPSLAAASSDDYFVNALYGFPTSSISPGAEVPLGMTPTWTYTRRPLALRCLDQQPADIDATADDGRASWKVPKRWQCSFASFKRYIEMTSRSRADINNQFYNITSPPISDDAFGSKYSKSDGCCERTKSFFELQCDSTTIDISTIHERCIEYRQRCPHRACDDGHTLNRDTLVCEKKCADNIGVKTNDARLNGVNHPTTLVDSSAAPHLVHMSLRRMLMFSCFLFFLISCGFGLGLSYAYIRPLPPSSSPRSKSNAANRARDYQRTVADDDDEYAGLIDTTRAGAYDDDSVRRSSSSAINR